MKQILFVNACMRGPEQSRTWRLSQAFLAACRTQWPEAAVKERDLTGCELPVLTGALAQERDRQAQVDAGSPMFEPAREMAQADLVVIAAPDWDMTFPAALKIYLEWTCTLGITFHYTRTGVQEGLCRAKELVYITTAGGPLEGKNFGFDYVRELGQMFGIPAAHCLSAEGLDILENDPEAILREAEDRAAALAEMLKD